MSSLPTITTIHKMLTRYTSLSCCKTENSISPPSSPCSSHSSLSLEAFTSSPSSSSCRHNMAESFSFNDLLSSNHSDPGQLNTPSSASSSSPSRHSQKRLALCQLDDVAPMKRLCDTDVHHATGSTGLMSASLTTYNNQCSSNFNRNETMDDSTGLAATSGDLDDVLDLLLQSADTMPASIMLADVRDAGRAAWMNAEPADAQTSCPTFTYEMKHCRQEGMEASESKLVDKVPLVSGAAPQCTSNVKVSNEYLAGSAREKNATWDMLKGQEQVEGANLMRRMNSTELSCAQQKQQINSILSPAASKNGTSRWAGPTLMDIESALAMSTDCPTINYPALVSSRIGNLPYRTAGSCFKDILHQETTSFLTTSSSPCKDQEPITLEEDDRISTWRRLRKRNQMEPRYTVKMRCEEDAVNDGYRWRKYGQKSIKNSPHPRSYYRCSSGKCGVKKQVERSSEDAGLLVVSYEGIHLHHRPTTFPTPSLLRAAHACVPSSSTSEDALPAGPSLHHLPTPSTTDDNKTSCTAHASSSTSS